MSTRRLGLLVLPAALAVALAGCAAGGAGAPAPQGALASLPDTPPRFRRMERHVRDGLADAAQGRTAALRARRRALTVEGIALIRAVLPHDVARSDVPRYLEGRARFGEALKDWVRAVESGNDAQVVAAIRALDAALRGWIDAYLGVAPETSV